MTATPLEVQHHNFCANTGPEVSLGQDFMRKMWVVGWDCNLRVSIFPVNEIEVIQMLVKMDLEKLLKNLDSKLQQMGRKRFTKSYLMDKCKGKELLYWISEGWSSNSQASWDEAQQHRCAVFHWEVLDRVCMCNNSVNAQLQEAQQPSLL